MSISILAFSEITENDEALKWVLLREVLRGSEDKGVGEEGAR
jgi:hypothetical protein